MRPWVIFQAPCTVATGSGTTISCIQYLDSTFCKIDPLTPMIIHGQKSTNQLLEVVATQGDPPPTFTCFADGIPFTNLMWRYGGLNDDGALPSGVTQILVPTSESKINLVWSRPLEYSDSGRYHCNVNNNNGSITTILDLLVKRE